MYDTTDIVECLLYEDGGDYDGDAIVFDFSEGSPRMQLVSGNARVPQTDLYLDIEDIESLISTLKQVRLRAIELEYGVKIVRE